VTKILVIDDDADIRFVIRMNLTAEGFDVVEAADGDAAVELARAERPDLVISDIMMPGRNGYEVLHDIRADPDLARIPVVFLSGKDADDEIWEGYVAGADYYLTKPFDPDELIAFVRHVRSEHPA
jgi:two-component system alkaline phosphatase synthesis response regulator PhoP